MADGDSCISSGNPKTEEDFAENTPRVLTLYKTETRYAFGVKDQDSKIDLPENIQEMLYTPHQRFIAIIEQRKAEESGIRKGDKVLEINGVSVIGAPWKQVVDLIKTGGSLLILTVASSTTPEVNTLQSCDDSCCYSKTDYSKKWSASISIPEYIWIEKNKKKFAVYDICVGGRHLCYRRYSEFYRLHNDLRKKFPDFHFPKLPGKWLFWRSCTQLNLRRLGLEEYLKDVCAVGVIAESKRMQRFFQDVDEVDGEKSPETDLSILLPDRTPACVIVRKNSSAEDINQTVLENVGFSRNALQYFTVFEMAVYGFEMELQRNIFLQNFYLCRNTVQ